MSQSQPSLITVRFGDDMMEAGFTVVPNLILRHYTTLGISPVELMVVIHIWEYWWSERDPYPALSTIAERMGMTRRNVRRHVQSLREKGYLLVTERNGTEGQTTSEYDFEPLLRAVLDLSRPLGQKRPRPPEESVRGGRTVSTPEEDEGEKDEQEEERVRIEAFIRDFAREMKDRAPLSSSVTRAVNLYHDAGVELEDFVAMLYAAREKTRKSAGVRNRMAFFYTVLERDLSQRSE